MVALLVRLKLIQTWRDLTRSRKRVVAAGIGVAYLALLVGYVAASVAALRTAPREQADPLAVLAGAGVTLLWAVGPLMATGVDQSLDPSRFAVLPVTARRLLPGMFVAGLFDVGMLASLVVAAGFVAAFAVSPGLTAAALVGAGLGLLTAFLASRVLTSAFGAAFASRRWRDAAAVALTVFAMLTGLAGLLVGRALSDGLRVSEALAVTAAVVGWSPVGWAWAIPACLSQGDLAGAAARSLAGGAIAYGLWRAWEHYVERGLTSPARGEVGGGAVRRTSRIDRLFGGSPAGAIAARCLRYWRRDPRHLTTAVALVLLPVTVGLSAEYGSGSVISQGMLRMLIPAIVGLVSGPSLAMDLAFDGSALWGHLAAGVRGRHDRIGRVMAFAALLLPVVLASLVVASFLVAPEHWLIMVAFTISATLSALGVGSLAGALWQVPVPPPGHHAFGRTSGGGVLNLLTTAGTLAATGLATAPTAVVGIVALFRPQLAWMALGIATGLGLVTLVAGVLVGGWVLDRRWPEVLRAVTYERA